MTEVTTGQVTCKNCLGYWTWDEAPRDTWPTPYAHTWNSEASARAYLGAHVCGWRWMTIERMTRRPQRVRGDDDRPAVIEPPSLSSGNEAGVQPTVHGYGLQERNEWARKTWPDHDCTTTPTKEQP